MQEVRMDKDELSKYRAEVIERFINVETLVDAIICQHYFKKMIINFYLEVLYDEYFSFGLKRLILEKIVKNIRNYFAHYNQEIIKGRDKKGEARILDPRNIEREIDFKGLHAEFMQIADGIEEYLFQTFKNLGGVAETD
jgi:hypothetical protein